MQPSSSDPGYLASCNAGVYNAMKAADPRTVYVMQARAQRRARCCRRPALRRSPAHQGWLFYNEPEFWQPEQAKVRWACSAREAKRR
jgi:hypothetical protein